LPIECTLKTLKQAKRFHATMPFENDTIGVKETAAKVLDYRPLIKDFPIDELLAATELGDSLCDAITNIFAHIQRGGGASSYPLQRLLQLVETISRDLREKMLSLLARQRLMDLPYPQAEAVMEDCQRVFQVWNKAIEDFREFAFRRKRRTNDKTLVRVCSASINQRFKLFNQPLIH
jgi:dynein heavy chain 1, cytosolic